MNIIYATYNIHHNSIDIYTHAGYFLRIDCGKAEEGMKTTPCSECALNALAIDEPLEYKSIGLVPERSSYKNSRSRFLHNFFIDRLVFLIYNLTQLDFERRLSDGNRDTGRNGTKKS